MRLSKGAGKASQKSGNRGRERESNLRKLHSRKVMTFKAPGPASPVYPAPYLVLLPGGHCIHGGGESSIIPLLLAAPAEIHRKPNDILSWPAVPLTDTRLTHHKSKRMAMSQLLPFFSHRNSSRSRSIICIYILHDLKKVNWRSRKRKFGGWLNEGSCLHSAMTWKNHPILEPLEPGWWYFSDIFCKN